MTFAGESDSAALHDAQVALVQGIKAAGPDRGAFRPCRASFVRASLDQDIYCGTVIPQGPSSLCAVLRELRKSSMS